MAVYLTNGGVHVDRPLSNMAVEAFDGGSNGFIGQRVMPRMTVDKQSNTYYVIDKDLWLSLENTRRSRGSPANRGEWQVSSDQYVAKNYAFGTELHKEDLANQDQALQLRQRSTRYVVDMLNRDREDRIASIVTSIDNMGSGTTLSGSDKWSDYSGSDPISDVNTAHAFIEDNTGLQPNTLILDKDTERILRYHPDIVDYSKYTSAGTPDDSVLRDLFGVDRIWVARGIKNNAQEGQSNSLTNIWGNNAVLARIEDNAGPMTATLGLSFVWRPEGFPAPLAVERFDDPEPSKKTERIEAQYFADEKVVASQLGYVIESTV